MNSEKIWYNDIYDFVMKPFKVFPLGFGLMQSKEEKHNAVVKTGIYLSILLLITKTITLLTFILAVILISILSVMMYERRNIPLLIPNIPSPVVTTLETQSMLPPHARNLDEPKLTSMDYIIDDLKNGLKVNHKANNIYSFGEYNMKKNNNHHNLLMQNCYN